jgi:hypothetical protein
MASYWLEERGKCKAVVIVHRRPHDLRHPLRE